MPTMNRYTLLPLLAALAACNAPDTFVLAAIGSGDAAPTDVSGDATGDAPADAARTDVAPTDVAIADAGDAADAADDQAGDVTSDAAQPDTSADVALADVALADVSDATGDAAPTDVSADASGAGDAPDDVDVFAVCMRITTIAECTAVRFPDGVHGCGWCGGAETCLYGFAISPIRGLCDGWTWNR